MIIAKNIAKHIADDILFENVSFTIGKKDKIGLVGPNGSGKSTLMQILMGTIESDGGTVQMQQERIAYVSQEITFDQNDTIESFLRVQHGINIEAALKQVGLGYLPIDFPIRDLSGGQKTRISIARALLNGPTLLFLDEPTNHLDQSGVIWLEGFIKNFNGSVLVISHDRRLLDTCVDKIFELDSANHAFNVYNGGYSAYISERAKRLEQQAEDYRVQQKEKKRLENRLALKKQEASVYSDPAKGRIVQALKKRLERDIYSQELTDSKDQKKMKQLRLQGENPASKLILRASDISKSFEGKPLFRNISLEIRGDERLVIAGRNGSGKTTLLNILAGKAKADSGEVRIGEGVRFGYFSQHHEDLDPNSTVMQEFTKTDRLLDTKTDPRIILGSFLFSGESVFKKVSDLSHGERVRLIFAKLICQANELLILDEPTNHLDIISREAIEAALLDYRGAIIVVSHDRYFLEKISAERQFVMGDK